MKFFKLFIICFIFVSCGLTNNETAKQPTKKPNYDINKSVMYYSQAQAAKENDDYKRALTFYMKADSCAPDNVNIKEEILELLSFLAKFDPKYDDKIIKLGNKYINQNLSSKKILDVIARTYTYKKNYQKANEFYQKLVEKYPNADNYIRYFYYQKKYYPPADTTMLEKALQMSEFDRDNILNIASLYEDYNSERSLEIYQQAYQKWGDKKVLKKLINFYEERDDWETIISLVKERFAKDKAISQETFFYVISRLFREKKYEDILTLKDAILAFDNSKSLAILLLTAKSEEDYELALQAGKKLENSDNFEELKESFYSYMAEIYLLNNNIDKALEYFLKSPTIKDFLSILVELNFDDSQLKSNFEKFMQELKLQFNQQDRLNYFYALYHIRLDDFIKSKPYIDSLSLDFIEKHDLYESIADTYIRINELDKAEEIIRKNKADTMSVEYKMSYLLYWNNQKDSLAANYIKKALEQEKKPPPLVYNLAAVILDNPQYQKYLLQVLQESIEMYPENSEILNGYGYYIAQHNITDEFEEAEKMLRKAIELADEKQADHIWDSLAWLYFQKNEYEKALEYMEKPLASGVNNSEIAYHLGKIYDKLDNKDEAIKYYKLAVKLDSPIKYSKMAKNILKEFNK